MDEKNLLVHLEELAHKLGISIRYENMPIETAFSAGGLCRIKGNPVIIINDNAPDGEKMMALGKALKRFDLVKVYIKPALRKFLEDISEKASM
ncbi:hypothetical protein ACFL2O_05800 [Thermodesulfobacteriota bacterium]